MYYKEIYAKDLKTSYYTVKPEYKGHLREPENVPFIEQLPCIYRFKLYAYLLNEEKK